MVKEVTKDNISVTENKNQYNQTTSSQINNNTVSTNIYGYDNQYITSQTGIDNTEISYTYDYLYGLLTSVTNNNVTTSYEYDEYKRLFKTNFTTGSIKYIYDDFGNIIKVSVLNNNTELLSYFFEYNNHFDIESIYIGKDTTKEHLISYEYYYKPSTSNTKIYTGLIEKVIKGKNQEYYERYEYNEEYDLYKTYIKKPSLKYINLSHY